MELDLENPLTVGDHESLFGHESDHMPSPSSISYLKSKDFLVSVRRQIISLVLQLCANNFDPYLSFLAVNYLDRCLCTLKLPQGKPWILHLLAVSCISLAVKMRKTKFSISNYQWKEGFIFDTRTIQRTEFLILGALKWRMRSITPFSFISFFISLFILKDPRSVSALKSRAIEIIFKSQSEIRLLVFKPSAISASALLSACHELFPLQFHSFEEAIASSSFVNKEAVFLCFNTMQEIEREEFESRSGDCETVVNVLDQRWSFSSESETTERGIKRRKVKESANENSFEISRF
ncbi:Cyclin, N-terminal [Dillenia turbinata]|uniref:Cyclin, N-terminal n=1 Tax=Dillenia turbinata TaxID=194707 RepID=A0AAN8UXK2_9MAGN